jgi:TrmH family RNA methyltransferase
MLTKNQIKLIAGLSQKSLENQHQLFMVEGKKGWRNFGISTFVASLIHYR